MIQIKRKKSKKTKPDENKESWKKKVEYAVDDAVTKVKQFAVIDDISTEVSTSQEEKASTSEEETMKQIKGYTHIS